MDGVSFAFGNEKCDRKQALFGSQKHEVSKQLSRSSNAEFSRYLKKDEQSKQSKWLNKLNDKPLLQLMSQQLQTQDLKSLQTGQLNCYQRLKKLLSAQKTNQNQQKTKQKILDNVVLMQSHINDLQDKYRQLQTQTSKKNSAKSLKISYLATKNNSFMVSASSLNTTFKDIKVGVENKKQLYSQHSGKISKIKKSIQQMRTLKEHCCDKFIKHKKELNHRIFQEVEQYIRNKLQARMQDIINCKVTEYYALKQQNSKFNQIILEKNLQIQTLKRQLKIKDQKLAALMQKQQPFQQLSSLKISMQQFCEEYRSLFGSLGLAQLKKKMDAMESMYINKYSKEESKHLQLYGQLQRQKDRLEAKLKQRMINYEERQRQLNKNLQRIQKMDRLDNSDQKHEIYNKYPQHKLKCSELEHLQKFILSKYVQWLDSRNQKENSIINLTSNHHQIEDYHEMISTVIQFNRNHGSPDKNIDFIAKLLSAIQKIKKLIFGGTNNQKLQPFRTLDEIQAYIKKTKLRKPTKTRTRLQAFRQATEHYLNDSNFS